MIFTDDFSALDTQAALAMCIPLPPRLTLQHAGSTRATRAGAAKGKLWMHAFIGMLLACLVMYLTYAIGASSGVGWSTAALTLLAWPAWFYWRQVSDSMQLFEQESWIDFEQRRWHSCKTYADATLAPVADSIRLDDLMLLCLDCFDAEGWLSDVSLCKTSAFDPASDQFPELYDTIGLVRSEEEALAFAVALAQCWGIPCWKHSAACDAPSQRLYTPW